MLFLHNWDDKGGLEGQNHLVTYFSDRDFIFMNNLKLKHD